MINRKDDLTKRGEFKKMFAQFFTLKDLSKEEHLFLDILSVTDDGTLC